MYREISVEPKGCVIQARFEDAELYRARKRLDPSVAGEIASAAALIIAVDAERVFAGLSEADAEVAVSVSIEGDDGIGSHRGGQNGGCQRLAGRAVRIEPSGWTGRRGFECAPQPSAVRHDLR